MKLRTIKENHLFGKAYSKGKRVVTSTLAVYVLPDYAAKRFAAADTRKQLKNRYGITVSTKVGGATVRSRCRRIIREGLYAIEQRGTLNQGFLIVIAARSAATTKTSTDIERDLDRAFSNLGLYKL